MRKLELSLDRLEVDSFETTAGDEDGRGTVLGRAGEAVRALCPAGGPYSPLCIPTDVKSDPTCDETVCASKGGADATAAEAGG